jgi:tetratricopeptide (TPR) repeat protein
VSRSGAAIAGVVTILCGCTYYNTLYNAERLYDEAEAARHAGRDSLAQARYRDVLRKTAEAYRGKPTDEHADEILFLLGRARLRSGDLEAARLALEDASGLAQDSTLRAEILVYRGLTLAALGDESGALSMVNEALASATLAGAPLADARLLRGSLVLRGGNDANGWQDLDLATEADVGVRVEAEIERLRLGIHHGDRERTRASLSRLLADGDAAARLDTIASLVGNVATRWNASTAAAMLACADSTRWEQPARGRIRLERARLLHSVGDTVDALDEAWLVARDRGITGAEARLLLARWRLASTRDLRTASAVRPVLLPAAEDARAAELVGALDDLDRYAGIGFDRPLGWFVAAEVARDRLDAPILARGLFLAYADTDPQDPWAPKALLAALGVSDGAEDRAWLRGRLEAYADSPYVLAARGGSAAGFEALEEELQVRLSEIRSR